jgi:hypothetical protein
LGDKTKITFAQGLVDELRQLLEKGPARTDPERGIRIYGPMAYGNQGLVLVFIDDVAKAVNHPEMKSLSLKWPVPGELGIRGFIGSAVEFPVS